MGVGMTFAKLGNGGGHVSLVPPISPCVITADNMSKDKVTVFLWKSNHKKTTIVCFTRFWKGRFVQWTHELKDTSFEDARTLIARAANKGGLVCEEFRTPRRKGKEKPPAFSAEIYHFHDFH